VTGAGAAWATGCSRRSSRGRAVAYHKLVLAAFNAAGLTLYRRLGFAEVGVCREQGQLDCKWVDVVVMERLL
jgi:L-amino acid N-acyltransferase YncA